MAKVSIKEIYQQNGILNGLLLSWHSMGKKQREAFIQEIQFFLDAAQQSEQSTRNRSTKIQLREMIASWDEFLSEPEKIAIPDLAVIAREEKSFSPSTQTKVEDVLPSDFFPRYWPDKARSISQPLSSNKVAHDSHITIPRDHKLKAIDDNIQGIVDARKHTE